MQEDFALELSICVIQKLALHQDWVEFRKWSIGFISTIVYLCHRGAKEKIVNGGRPAAKIEDSPKEGDKLKIKDNLKKRMT